VQSQDFGNYNEPDTLNYGPAASSTNVPRVISPVGDGPNGFNQPAPRARFVRPVRSAERPISTARVESDVEPLQLSPQQMNAINAFRQAGQRRARRNDERERERERERELEMARQKKLKERAAGRRIGKAKAGDVDGVSPSQYTVIPTLLIISCSNSR
jgi:hypothetical protein